MPSLEVTTAEVTSRLLRRLPPSLWDVDPASPTLQRDLARALAAECALWLEQREVARTMTVLLEAQGVDLDVLLSDYGLRRYLQRPDDVARQIAMQILWRPQGTLHALTLLADLLFVQPHVVRRTGRHHAHVFVASSTPVTTPYSYWGLVSQEGHWYALTVQGDVPVIHPAPPPGLDVAPGPQTLHWATARDATDALWYVTIAGDTLAVHQAASPPPGTGTLEPILVLDGAGQRWRFTVDAATETLLPVLDVAPQVFGYWQLRERITAALRYLWIEAQVPTLTTSPPGGATDQTPGGAALDWFTAIDEAGTPWYVTVEDDTLVTTRLVPGGTGTAIDPALVDVHDVRWRLTVSSGSEAVVTTLLRGTEDDLVVVAPGHPWTALALVDSTGVPWWLSVASGAPRFTPQIPAGAQDATPPGGPYRWLRAFDLPGARWYISPSTTGALVAATTTPGGLGTASPTLLGDAEGVGWHYGVTAGGTFAVSATPAVDYGGLPTTICLADDTGTRWLWWVEDGHLSWATTVPPGSIDQSPWGDLAWFLAPLEGGGTAYVFPRRNGLPTAAAAPTAPAFWGWLDPITLVDAAGQGWTCSVVPRATGQLYWRVRDSAGTLAYLTVEGLVPSLTTTPPSGTDASPGGAPVDWWTAYDATGQPVYVQVDALTLVTRPDAPSGSGTGSLQPFEAYDATGTLWHLAQDASSDTLVLVAIPNTMVVQVLPTAPPTIPPPTPGLPLRDAVEAFHHIQAAGSLVTVLVQ